MAGLDMRIPNHDEVDLHMADNTATGNRAQISNDDVTLLANNAVGELYGQLLHIRVAAVRNMGIEDTGKGEICADKIAP